jgi:hypothetical protein
VAPGGRDLGKRKPFVYVYKKCHCKPVKHCLSRKPMLEQKTYGTEIFQVTSALRFVMHNTVSIIEPSREFLGISDDQAFRLRRFD